MREIVGFFLLVWNIIAQLLFLFYAANDFSEYVNCISATCASAIVIISFTAIAFRKATLFESIEYIEKLIDTSNRNL